MNPPGRFLKKDPIRDVWHEIGNAKAHEKTMQALRENAFNVRKQIIEEEIQEKCRNIFLSNEQSVINHPQWQQPLQLNQRMNSEKRCITGTIGIPNGLILDRYDYNIIIVTSFFVF